MQAQESLEELSHIEGQEWLQSPSTVTLESKKIEPITISIFSPFVTK